MATMYLFLKGLHSLLRWVVVLGGLFAIVTVVRGLLTRAAWGGTERLAGTLFTRALNIQFVLGIILFVVSPLIRGALSNMGAAMGNDTLRFFTVEHTTFMLLAVVAAEVGNGLARRATTDRAKFVRASIGFVLAGVLIVFGIPWGRSLVPWA